MNGPLLNAFFISFIKYIDDESDGRFLVDFNRKKMEQIINERRKNEGSQMAQDEHNKTKDSHGDSDTKDPAEQW